MRMIMDKNLMLNEKIVLESYIKLIENKKLNFLENKIEVSETLIKHLKKLENADSMHEKITHAKEIWKILFESAMSFIDPDKSGYDTLFNYFDDFVDFEELIFASDSFYRDHTLHCLWVYFLGEYIHENEEFNYIFSDIESYKEIRKLLDDASKINNEEIRNKIKPLFENHYNVINLYPASRCIVSLTHDLGYPLKKINKINKAIRKVLPYYSIKKINEYNFDYSIEQNNYIKEFIVGLSTNYNYDIGNIQKQEINDEQSKTISKIFITKAGSNSLAGIDYEFINSLCEEDINFIKKFINIEFHTAIRKNYEIKLLQEIEKSNHGIMSAFLLFNTLEAFTNNESGHYLNGDVSSSFYNEHPIIEIKKLILLAMTSHTMNSFKIKAIDGLPEFLTFVDEIEEFSRISRADQNRQFINEFCNSSIYISEEDNQKWFNLDFIFENNHIDNLNPELTFKGKCRRFIQLFDINNLDENLKINFRCIGKLKKDSNIYHFKISRKKCELFINNDKLIARDYLKTREIDF